jgi:hypothetical protein
VSRTSPPTVRTARSDTSLRRIRPSSERHGKAMLTSLSGLLVISALGHQGLQLPQRAPGSVSLTVMCEGAADHPRLTFTIKNTGTEDTTVSLGSALSGRIYMVYGLTLFVKQNPGDRLGRYQYRPRRYPAAVSGSLTDWLAPLPIATSYTTIADFSDFGGLEIPKAAELSLEWEIQAPPHHTVEAQLGKFWIGTLRSNEVRFPEQCRP